MRVVCSDASGTNLSCTVTITGVNQFGERVEEAATVTGSATAAYTDNCFARVDKIILTSVANNTTSDTLGLGWNWSATTTYAVPVRINVDSSVGIAEKAGGSSLDTIKTMMKNGVVDDSNVTVMARYHGIRVAGAAVDDYFDIVLNQPFGE